MTPDERFEQLLNRKATRDERSALLRMKKGLQLSDDDPIWLIFIGLHHYQKIYEEIPTKIQIASKSIVDAVVGSAVDRFDSAATRSAAKVDSQLKLAIAALEDALRTIAAIRRQMVFIIASAVIGVALISMLTAALTVWVMTSYFGGQ